MLSLDRVSVNTSSSATSTGPKRAFQLLLGEALDVDFDPEIERDVDLGGDITTDALWLADHHPQSPAAQVRLAQAYLASRALEEARKTALKGGHLAIDQSDVPAIVGSATILAALDDWNHAEELLTLAAEEPVVRVFWAACAARRRDWTQALARLGETTDFGSNHLAAWIALQQQNFHSAIHHFRAAIRYGDPSPDLMADLGFAYASVGARRKAERATSIAVRMAPRDLQTGLNLVTFRTAVRDYEGAFKELDRLSDVFSEDLRLSMAKASLLQQLGEPNRAQRELQLVAASQRFWRADALQQEELRALESMIAFDSGRLPREDLISRLERAVERTEGRSLLIAQGLANVYSISRRYTEKLRSLVDRMMTIHSQDSLYALMIRLAVNEQDYESASTLSHRWLGREPFNVWAAAQATFVLIGLARYEDAMNLGISFLTRVDDRSMVLNNTAYASAMQGHLDRARDLIKRAESNSPYIVATRALIDVLSGNVDAGRVRYLEAAKLANEEGQDDLAFLIQFKLNKVLASLGIESDVMEVPKALQEDPRFELIELEATLQASPRHG